MPSLFDEPLCDAAGIPPTNPGTQSMVSGHCCSDRHGSGRAILTRGVDRTLLFVTLKSLDPRKPWRVAPWISRGLGTGLAPCDVGRFGRIRQRILICLGASVFSCHGPLKSRLLPAVTQGPRSDRGHVRASSTSTSLRCHVVHAGRWHLPQQFLRSPKIGHLIQGEALQPHRRRFSTVMPSRSSSPSVLSVPPRMHPTDEGSAFSWEARRIPLQALILSYMFFLGRLTHHSTVIACV